MQAEVTKAQGPIREAHGIKPRGKEEKQPNSNADEQRMKKPHQGIPLPNCRMGEIKRRSLKPPEERTSNQNSTCHLSSRYKTEGNGTIHFSFPRE